MGRFSFYINEDIDSRIQGEENATTHQTAMEIMASK